MVEISNQHTDLMEFISSSQEVKDFLQLAILGSLTQKVIHETNNQLTGILGYVTLAQKTSPISEEILSFLKRTIQCCETSQSINNAFIDFFHANEASPAALSFILPEVISFCQKVFAPNCSVVLKENSLLPDIVAKKTQVRSMLLYLLMAVKSELSDCGEIQISTWKEDTDKEPSHFFIAIDLKPTHTAQSFQRRRRKNESSSNLTKELSYFLAQELAVQCGGKIICNQDETRSLANYHIVLPLQGKRKNSSALRNSCESSVPDVSLQQSCKMILLEDQPVIADFIQTLLNHEGHLVSVYNNGNDLAAALPTMNLSAIDVFLLDICVPGINGIEVGTLIRQNDPDSRIVFYSALRNEISVLNHFSLDNKTRFLQKPFKKEELFELVQSVLATKE